MERDIREFTDRVRLAHEVGLVPAEVWRALDLDQDGQVCDLCHQPSNGKFCYSCEVGMFGEYC